MTIGMEAVAAVTALLLLEYAAFVMLVGRARGRYGVRGPAVTGHEGFERTLRVQQNTLEQLVLVVPGLWLFGWYLSAAGAALLGLVFFVARIVYARGYLTEAGSRGLGFALGGVAALLLVLGGLVGALIAMA